MTPPEIRELYARKAAAMARRPAFARATGAARVKLGDGVLCQVEHDDRAQWVDLPVSDGGTGTGLFPGQLMRASLGACLAIGYRLWGARLEVPIVSVAIDIACDIDARGQMGLASEAAVGWEQMRFMVTIVSPAPETEVRRVVELADRLSPMLANISPTVRRAHHLTVVAPESGSMAAGSAGSLAPGSVARG
jgi:uncharacterized OsmC-like protein